MNTKMKKIQIIALLSLALIFMNACKKDDESKVSVKLTDDPFPIGMASAANIGIAKIELKNSDGNYVTVFNGNANVNMLNYTNGATAEVTVNTVPEGTYVEAKIYLNSASVELSDGRNFDAEVSASHSHTVSINPAVEVGANDTGELLIDMDLSDSFNFQVSGMGGWISDVMDIMGLSSFNPDFRAVNLSQTGSIEGSVTDANGNSVAYAYVHISYDYNGDGDPDTVSTICDEHGHYAIIGIPEGNYTVVAETSNNSGLTTGVQVSVQHNVAANVTIN